MNTHVRYLIIAGLASQLFACAPLDSATDVDETEDALIRAPRPGEETQGRKLIGDTVSDSHSFQPSDPRDSAGIGLTSFQAFHGELWAQRNGQWIHGASLVGAEIKDKTDDAGQVRVRITGYSPATAADACGSVPQYTIKRVGAGGVLTPYCKPDLQGRETAIVVGGNWDATGKRWSGRLTLGCRSGAVAKCVCWGYKPWETPDSSNTTQMRDIHQACTRMIRADYCGDGKPHTYDGTPVNVWDNATPTPIRIDDDNPITSFRDNIAVINRPTLGGVTRAPVAGFEAGWGIDGARCLSHNRWANMPPNLCESRASSPFWTLGIAPDTVDAKSICDSDQEAIAFASRHPEWKVRIFNESDNNIVP